MASIVHLRRATVTARHPRAKIREIDGTEISVALHSRRSPGTSRGIAPMPMLSLDRVAAVFHGKAAPRQILVLHHSNSSILTPSSSSVTLHGSAQLLICDVCSAILAPSMRPKCCRTARQVIPEDLGLCTWLTRAMRNGLSRICTEQNAATPARQDSSSGLQRISELRELWCSTREVRLLSSTWSTSAGASRMREGGLITIRGELHTLAVAILLE